MKYDCSKILDYQHEVERLHNSHQLRLENCEQDCVLGFYCSKYGIYDFQSSKKDLPKMIDIVQKWSDEHPEETILDEFKRNYPNALLENDDNTPTFCPSKLGYKDTEDCNPDKDCPKCWGRTKEEAME